MNERVLFVFAYDSPDDRRRARIARVLEDIADRVQHSVFEGWLTEAQVKQTVIRLQRLVDPSEDDLRVYRQCAYCLRQAQVLGPNGRRQAAEYWIV